MRKILHIIDHMERDPVQINLSVILSQLQELDISSSILCLRGEGTCSTDFEKLGIPIQYMNYPKYAWYPTTFADEVRKYNADIIHAHLLKSIAFAGSISSEVSIPILLHDSSHIWRISNISHHFPQPLLALWYRRWVLRKFVPNCFYAVIHEEDKVNMERLFRDRRPKECYILPYADTSITEPDDTYLPQSKMLPALKCAASWADAYKKMDHYSTEK